MLVAKNIFKKYETVEVLRGVSLEIKQGEMVSIIGASGAGKSTLLHILGTLDKADRGEVVINNQTIQALSEKELAKFRNKNIGFVFQFHHLLPEFTALENVCIPAWIANENKKSTEEKAKQLLTRLGLQNRMENKPNQMSGGEQQRVAVARALINNPSIIFADEPTGNLDSNHAKEMHQLFVDLCNEFNKTFVIVTHNDNLAAISKRVIRMKDGNIVE